MIQQVCGNIMPKLIPRIGGSEDMKMMLVKVVLHNEQDNKKILNNLQSLGNTEYKGISITEDYIISERQIVKEFANKAIERN